MLRTRWHKVFIDLWSNRTRTLIVALAVAVGVYAVGTVVSARTLLTREFDNDQADAQVASAIIRTYPFDDEFVKRVAEEPGVVAAEGRNIIPARIFTGPNEWEDMLLVSLSEFEDSRVDKVLPVAGNWPPKKNEVIVERLALGYIGAEIGDSITVEFDDGRRKKLTIAGTGHDPQQFNPDLTGFAAGYVTPETMGSLGFGQTYTELHVRTDEIVDDDVQFRAVIEGVEDRIERSGRPILSTTIMTESLVESIVDTVVLLLTVFGIIILLLSGFLVINTISALIAQQLKQIGVMKLVGARRSQIVAMYLLMVLFYGIIAIIIGIPLATLTARLLMTELIEGLVNIRSDSYALPMSIIFMQVSIGLLLPLIAGLIPVLKGTRITTHKALNDVGIGSGVYGQGLVERLLASAQRITSMQRPLLLAIRNTLRHKGRLIQTLAVLIMGTALFISVLTVRSSVNQTLQDFLHYHQYDVSIGFESPHRMTKLARIAKDVPGVADLEGWTISGAVRVRPDDSQSNGFQLNALPADSAYVAARIEEGRWLLVEDENALVVNSEFVDDEPDVIVGSEIVLDIDNQESNWQIVGIVQTDAQGPSVYVTQQEFGYLTRQPDQVTHLQVVTERHEGEFQSDVEAALIERFEDDGLRVKSSRTTQTLNEQNELMFDIIVAIMIMMALLLAAVGGLGLTTTMSINILERIREIGVLRAIGASNASVRQIVLVEGIVIGALSWIIGVLISIPLSAMLSEQVGLALLGIPLSYSYALVGAIGWFFGILIVAVVASLGPAKDAVGLTIREVLAYE